MPSTTRTFIALTIPEPLGVKLSRLQSLLAAEVPGARWMVTPPFHVTLAFLGDVENSDLNDVCRAVAGAAVEVEPFELRLEVLGVFPNPLKARTLWVGLSGPGLTALETLQRKVAQAVAAASYPPADSRFHPHVTLGRLKPGREPSRDLTPLLKHYQTWSAGSCAIDEVVTFASTLTPDGPVYAPLGRAPLRSEKAH